MEHTAPEGYGNYSQKKFCLLDSKIEEFWWHTIYNHRWVEAAVYGKKYLPQDDTTVRFPV